MNILYILYIASIVLSAIMCIAGLGAIAIEVKMKKAKQGIKAKLFNPTIVLIIQFTILLLIPLINLSLGFLALYSEKFKEAAIDEALNGK